MPEFNQAVLLRDAITVLQYVFLALLYYFIYHIGKLLYLDLQGPQASKSASDASALPESSGSEAFLTVLTADGGSGLKAGDRILLQLTNMIGRSNRNTIVIQESFVSAEHAIIQQYKDRYWLSDLCSTNGTFINGNRIEDEIPLSAGDEIKIGSVTLRFER